MFMEKKPYAALVPLFVAALAASAALALFLKPLWVGLLSAALVVACFGIGMVIIGARWRQLQQECDDIFLENSSAASSIINTIDGPALIFDDAAPADLVHPGQGGVEADGFIQDQSVGLAVLGDVGQAVMNGLLRSAQIDLFSVDVDLAGDA